MVARRTSNRTKCFLFFVIAILLFFLFAFFDFQRRASHVLTFLRNNGHFVASKSIMNFAPYQSLIEHLKYRNNLPPLIIFLNQHALNTTMNWLCNTKDMTGVHDQLVVVAVDRVVQQYFAKKWPTIVVFYYPVKPLQEKFSSASPTYQLFYLFRANLALSLAKSGIAFWTTQQDMIWTRNFLSYHIENSMKNADLIFDRHMHDDGFERETINGATWFVRPNERTILLLETLIAYMKTVFAPDAAILTKLCHDRRKDAAHCSFLPYSLSSGASWFSDARISKTDSLPPAMHQFDIGSPASKADTMAEFGVWFVDSKGNCDDRAVQRTLLPLGITKIRQAVSKDNRFSFIHHIALNIFEYSQMLPIVGKQITQYGLMISWLF